MRAEVSTKIIFHWILMILIIGLLAYFIEINTIVFSILISLFLLTLILNRTTYLNLKNGQLIITKKNFLFIPTFKLSIDINKIDKLTIINYRNSIPEYTRRFVDFEAVIIVEILTGTYFYKPTNKLIIDLGQNNLIEIEINVQRKRKIKQKLKKKLTQLAQTCEAV
ncbi:MAG: hypothetical protein K8R31_14960 [Bacteroidales bacterium]|nr:hypothetical protein [Bacteroidales bacterium]